MITLFNRKELFITFSMQEQANIRSALHAAGIRHTVAVKSMDRSDLWGSSRSRLGSTGINQAYTAEYKIYVHKKDFDNAAFVVHKMKQ